MVDLPPDHGPMKRINGFEKISGSPKCLLLRSRYLYIVSSGLIALSKIFLSSLRRTSPVRFNAFSGEVKKLENHFKAESFMQTFNGRFSRQS